MSRASEFNVRLFLHRLYLVILVGVFVGILGVLFIHPEREPEVSLPTARAEHYDELVAGGTLVGVSGLRVGTLVPSGNRCCSVLQIVSSVGQDSQGYYAVLKPTHFRDSSDIPEIAVLAPTKLYLGESAPGFADNGEHVKHKVGTITFVALESSSVWFVVHYDTPQ